MPRQRPFTVVTLLLSLSLLWGCPPPPFIPDVPEPVALTVSPDWATEITLTEVRFALNPLQSVGGDREEMTCMFHGPLLWSDLRTSLDQSGLQEAFKREFATIMASHGERISGDTHVAVRPQGHISRAYVTASIVDLRVDLCWQDPGRHSHSYALGKIYMKIEWGLLSGEGGKTVSKLYSEGGADSDTAIPTREMFGRAFRQAARGFQASFARAGSSGG
jgi:hypothetical protein